MMGRVSFHTFGCKLNFAETATMQRDMLRAGYERVSVREPADVVVINTCSVTEAADRKCRALVRRVRRQSAKAKVVLVGCYAQLQPDALFAHPGVDYVLGASEKFSLPKMLREHPHGAKQVGLVRERPSFFHAHSQQERTRAFLKVQDGCDYGCSFCTIPLARGRSRSASLAALVAQVEQLVETGVKEVVLTGVNLGDFGKSQGGKETDFLSLLQALEGVQGVARYRISSIEPNLLHDEIIAFVAQSPKFSPHFHMPLQSGADEILKRMRRRYLTALYEHRVAKIREMMPNACLGVDVIVGFPGEDERHFRRTFDFLHALPVSYLHVFPYSARANTLAAAMPSQQPSTVKKRRAQMLQNLSEKKKRDFYAQQLGKNAQVLFENKESDGNIFGFTDNYVRVAVPHQPQLVNQLLSVSLQRLHADGYVEAYP